MSSISKSLLVSVLGPVAVGSVSVNGQTLTLRQVAEMDFNSPAVSTFVTGQNGQNAELLQTYFIPTSRGETPGGPPKYGISRVANVNDVFDGISTPVHEIITNDVVWPNEAKPLPSGTIIGLDDAYIYSGGFFAALKVTGFDPATGPILTQLPGDVAIFRKGPQNTVEKVQLTKSIPNDPSFYHKTAFMDCDGDGKMDIVTARTYVEFTMQGPAIDDARTEMLCLMQPENWDSDEWTEHLIVSGGPGVAFELTDFNEDGKKEILASEFFVNQQLSIYKCEKEAWTLCSEDDLVIEVLDNANGRYFHVSTADLDGDGDEDIVATTSPHARGAPFGGQVWAYENKETCEFKTRCFLGFICIPLYECRQEWIQHMLTDKFEVKDPFGANGTPGDVHAFHPVKRGDNNGKIPYLLLSGDDGGFTAVLEPKGTRRFTFNWEYTVNKFKTGEQTFGAPAVAYVNDDRYADIVVPEFSANKVHFFTYAPAN